MHQLIFSKTFDRNYVKIIKKDRELEKRAKRTLQLLQIDPFYPSLKTHKANTKNYCVRWSSWVTGDIRIIWDFDKNNQIIILLLDIGKHSGKEKIYR